MPATTMMTWAPVPIASRACAHISSIHTMPLPSRTDPDRIAYLVRIDCTGTSGGQLTASHVNYIIHHAEWCYTPKYEAGIASIIIGCVDDRLALERALTETGAYLLDIKCIETDAEFDAFFHTHEHRADNARIYIACVTVTTLIIGVVRSPPLMLVLQALVLPAIWAVYKWG
jgi:hypothetical protein